MLLEGGNIIEVKGGDTKSHLSNQDEVLKEIKKINTRLSDQDDKIKSLTDNVNTRLEHWPSIRLHVNDEGGPDNTNIAPWVEVTKRKSKPVPTMVRQKG